ncbi:MAG TPA: helix-turn-helix domain-containing protein [candidate division Zixibacteria bacterium]|nr:helix-turn-helix domain-containing protein [candidate division Zixibacteria bacterium]
MTTRTREESLAAIGLLDEPVRLRIYDWVVAQHRPAGREEVSRALGITRALATFHLDRLAEAGLLDSGYQRLTGRVGPGAGRPARVYWRARGEVDVSLPARRYRLAAGLFAAALRRIGGDRVPDELRSSARELGEELGSQTSRRGAPRTRLLRALEAGGYEPVTDRTGTIRLRNCPFDALVDDHRPLVCGTNLALSQGIARGSGAEELEPVLDPQPGFCCVAFVPRGRAGDAENGAANGAAAG